MSNVTLKGSKDGYSVIISDQGDFDQSLKELKELIIKQNVGSSFDDVIQFTIKTGNRLLNSEQKDEVEDIFSEYPQIEVVSIDSDVRSADEIDSMIRSTQMNIESGIVRSGQKKEYEGDVLFLGSLHKGAHISTTGSIYIIGKVEGIVQAGYPNNTDAAIFGNLANAAQLRIADVIEIVTEDNSDKFKDNQFAYIDDLHNISIDDVTNYRERLNDTKKRVE